VNQKKPLAVVKVGGDILLDDGQRIGLVRNILGLLGDSWHVVVLHGGGPQISAMQSRLGITPRKVAGRRITSDDDLEVVKQVLCGQINVDLVSIMQAQGVNAFGCHGASGKIIGAQRREPTIVSGGGTDPIDFGEVGDVTTINTQLVACLLDTGVVPVLASIGINDRGDIFNINADTTVVQMAKQMTAQLLIFVTGIGGIYRNIDDPQSRFAHLDVTEAREYIDRGIIMGGMIPKVEEALSLLQSGIDTVAIVDAKDAQAFMSIAQGKTDYGTLIRVLPS